MPISTGQCPSCYATNSYNATNCLECGVELPWAATAAANAQRKAQEAQQAAIQAQAAAQVQAAAQAHAAAQAQAAVPRQAPGTASVSPWQPQPPGVDLGPPPMNVYEAFARSIVGSWGAILENCTTNGALAIGLACAVIFNLCVVIGSYLIMQKVMSFMSMGMGSFPMPNPSMPNVPGSMPEPTLPGMTMSQVFKLGVVGATPFLSLALSSLLVRMVFSRDEEGSFLNDLFVAGISLLPLGFFTLLTGCLGMSNIQVLAVASVFLLSYSIVILYNGCTIVSRIRESAAALCVPLMLILSAWITKIIFTHLLNV